MLKKIFFKVLFFSFMNYVFVVCLTTKYLKTWGCGSAGEVLALKAQGPEFDFHQPSLKESRCGGMHCNTGDSLA